MRILFLITDLEVGGTEKVLARLVSRLDRTRFDPVVVTLKGEGPVGREVEAAGVPLVNLKLKGPFDLCGLARLLATICRHRPEILHAFLFHANVLGRLAGRLAGVPRIITSIRTLEGGIHHAPLERLTWTLGDDVVCVSEAVRAFAKRRLGIARSEIIPNGVSATTGGPGIQADVVAGSRLAPGKGMEDFLRAAGMVSASHPEIRFAVIGAGAEEQSLRAGAPRSVAFVGQVADLASALKGCRMWDPLESTCRHASLSIL